MPQIINLPTFSDNRGNLTVVEKILPFDIKRFYYIYGASEKRGGHRHKKTRQALICLGGSCDIFVDDGKTKVTYSLDKAEKCLLLDAGDWHTMDNFSQGSTLLVFSSEFYDIDDYVDEAY